VGGLPNGFGPEIYGGEANPYELLLKKSYKTREVESTLSQKLQEFGRAKEGEGRGFRDRKVANTTT